jgi:hypothetical protein
MNLRELSKSRITRWSAYSTGFVLSPHPFPELRMDLWDNLSLSRAHAVQLSRCFPLTTIARLPQVAGTGILT